MKNDPTPKGRVVESLASETQPTPAITSDDGGTRRLSTGRVVREADCTDSAPIFDVLEREAPTFRCPEDVGTWVGRFYGWRSTTPTHAWAGWDGAAWWILNALAMIDHRWPTSYFDPVPGLEMMTAGHHADVVFAAFDAAGLTMTPIETAAT